jgi:transposase
MMAYEFWLSDAQRAAIDPLLPKNRPGARWVDDRRVISGIVHVLKSGCRWQRLPLVLRSADDNLQPLSSMVGAWPLAEAISRLGNSKPR